MLLRLNAKHAHLVALPNSPHYCPCSCHSRTSLTSASQPQETPVSEISDGQPQVPVSQIADGQPQAPVSQISDGQPQAPVSQISDGQPQAPTGAPVTQISDGQ